MAARTDDTFDIASNRSAEAGMETKGQDLAGDDQDLDDIGTRMLSLARNAASQGRQYIDGHENDAWINAYRAYHNEHYVGSKYTTAQYRGRSRLFRPKTRSMIRGHDAQTAAALFSTTDVVQITAEDDSDPKQLAAAKLKHELVNYRLDGSSEHNAFPWFMTAVGANQISKLIGWVCSKQFWQHEKTLFATVRKVPVVDEELDIQMRDMDTDEPLFDWEDIDEERVRYDRPNCTLYAPEDVIRDPSALWTDQVNGSAYLGLRHPMHITDLRQMIEARPEFSSVEFFDITDAQLRSAVGRDENAQATRLAREQNNNDRYNDNKGGDREFDIIWPTEWFIRWEGRDWHFWTLTETVLLSKPIPVELAYPHKKGFRPVVIGVGTIEPHKISPMSHVNAVQPLQVQANDITNLMLDGIKQTINAIAIIKNGSDISPKQLQNRGPDAHINVNNMDDLQFERPGEVSAMGFAQDDRLSAEFDDLSGRFAPSSVNNNRNLSETVGGMNLLSGAANAIGEFDLRVFAETWVEPVLRDITTLIEYYETDAKILAVAGQKAKIQQMYGIDEITDELLDCKCTLRVDVGMGSADPMKKLEKFRLGTETIAAALSPEGAAQAIKPRAVVEEVFGLLGYRDGARFYNLPEEEEVENTDAKLQEAMQMVQQLQAALEDKQADRQHESQMAQLNISGDLREQEMENQNRLAVEKLRHQNSMQQIPLSAFVKEAQNGRQQRARGE
ncbi:MAG: hypothetical protein GY952_14135 [Rhodobacteraceae bacterium]|nr:hypothetical protein [Paracoccaceae bacterium]